MAELVDVAGRLIQTTDSIDALTTEIREGMQSALKTVDEFADRDQTRNDTLENIKEMMEQLNVIAPDVAAIKDAIQQSIQMHTDRQRGGPEDTSERLMDTPTKMEQASNVISAETTGPPDQQPAEQISDNLANNAEEQRQTDPFESASFSTVVQQPEYPEQEFSPLIIDMHGQEITDWLEKNQLQVQVVEVPETIAEGQAGESIVMGAIPAGAPAGAPPDQPPPPERVAGAGGRGGRGGGLTQTGQKQVMRSIARVAAGLSGIMAAITGGIAVSNIFEGVIKEELDYHKIMSRIAFQSHGLSETSATWRDNFRSAGDRLKTVAQTGHKIGEWMKGMVKMQQRGLKNQKFNDKLLKSALNMATMTGIETEAVTEMYGDWAQHFKMTNGELATMNIAMKDIVRQTGLTGKNLQEAMKNTEGLLRKMRGAGTATQETVAMMARLSALAQTEGVGDVFDDYASALTGGFENFTKMDERIQSSVVRFAMASAASREEGRALVAEIHAGRGGTEENLRKIAEGMRRDTNARFAKVLKAGEDFKDLDLTKIDSQRLRSMQMMSEQIYGKSLQDLQKIVKINMQAGMTLQQRIGESMKDFESEKVTLQKQLAQGLIDEGQYNQMLSDRKAQMDTQIADLQMGDISKTLNKVLLDGAKEGGAHFTDTLVKAGQESAEKQMKQAKAQLDANLITQQQYNSMLQESQAILSNENRAKEAGIALTQEGFARAAQDVQTKMDTALASGTIGQSMYDEIMGDFDAGNITKELEEAMAGGKTERVAELQGELIKMQQTADVQDIKGKSVVDKIENHVGLINAKLRNIFSDGLIGILEKVGAVAIILTMMGASIAQSIAGLGIVMTTILGAPAMLVLGKTITKGLAKPFRMLGLGRGARAAAAGGRAARGARVAGIGVTRASVPKGKAKSFLLGKAGGHFTAAGAEMRTATAGMRTAVGNFATSAKNTAQGMKTSVGRFATSVKTNVKNSRVVQAASRKLDDAAKGIMRAGRSMAASPAGVRVAAAGARVATQARGAGRFVAGKADDVVKGAVRLAGRAPGAARTAGTALKASKVGRGAIAAGRTLQGVGKAGLMAARGTAAAIRATTSWTIIIPVAISAIEGFAGAMMAGSNAAELFGDKNMEVTERMRIAAEGAGIFTGMLDGLTFGLFGKWIGPTGTLTAALAKLMHTFWPLAMVLQAILLPFKILWGILKGLYLFLKNAFIGLWEGIKLAVEPIVEIFDILWDAVSEIGGVFTELIDSFGIFGDTSSGLPSVVDVISGALGFLGKVVGWLFKAIGFLINIALKPLVKIIAVVVKVLVWLIKIALAPVILAIKAMAKAFTWLYDKAIRPVIDAVKTLYTWFVGKEATKGFTETAEEQSKTWKEEGATVSHGVGGVAGGVKEVLFKAVASKLNPFNWFQEGTRKIEKTGIGMLHAGEAVIPANIVENMKAVGDGPFKEGGEGGGLLTGLKSVFHGLFGLFDKPREKEVNLTQVAKDQNVPVETLEAIKVGDTAKVQEIQETIGVTDASKVPESVVQPQGMNAADLSRTLGVSGAGPLSVKAHQDTGGVQQGSAESNKMKEFYVDLSSSLKNIFKYVKDIFSFLSDSSPVAEGEEAPVLMTDILRNIKDINTQILGLMTESPKSFGKLNLGTVAKGGFLGDVLSKIDATISDLPVIGGLFEKAKAMASQLNPFNWFEEGTRKIEKTGIGMLHAGEAVIPAKVAEDMKAVGSGPFKKDESSTASEYTKKLADRRHDMVMPSGGSVSDYTKKLAERRHDTTKASDTSVSDYTKKLSSTRYDAVKASDASSVSEYTKKLSSTRYDAVKASDASSVSDYTKKLSSTRHDAVKASDASSVSEYTKKLSSTRYDAVKASDASTVSEYTKKLSSTRYDAVKASDASSVSDYTKKLADRRFNAVKDSGVSTTSDYTKKLAERRAGRRGAGIHSDPFDGASTKVQTEPFTIVPHAIDPRLKSEPIGYSGVDIQGKDTQPTYDTSRHIYGMGTEDLNNVINLMSKSSGPHPTTTTVFEESDRMKPTVDDTRTEGLFATLINTVKESPLGQAVGGMVDAIKESPLGQVVSGLFNDTEGVLNETDSFDASNWVATMGTGEVTVPDTVTGETRTMSAEESAEARLTRHKVEGQPQQVVTHGTDTATLEGVGLDQLSMLGQIRDGINKLNSQFNVDVGPGSDILGAGDGVDVGDPTTRHTGNAAALDFGASPYSPANEAGMQQVVSISGVG